MSFRGKTRKKAEKARSRQQCLLSFRFLGFLMPDAFELPRLRSRRLGKRRKGPVHTGGNWTAGHGNDFLASEERPGDARRVSTRNLVETPVVAPPRWQPMRHSYEFPESRLIPCLSLAGATVCAQCPAGTYNPTSGRHPSRGAISHVSAGFHVSRK